MKKLISILVMLCCATVTQAQVHVGNGGEGVLVDGRIILRDLYEAGHYDFEVGTNVDPKIKELVEKSRTLAIGVDAELFARVLTDLEKIRPGLGFVTIHALQYYHHRVLNSSLPRLPEIQRQTENELTQLAIRRLNRIEYAKPDLERMDQKQQVALLVHEGLYSLLKIECSKDGRCMQSAPRIRQLIGKIFAPGAGANNFLKYDLENYLELPRLVEVCEQPYFFGRLTLWSVDPLESRSPEKELLSTVFNLYPGDTTERIEEVVASFCREAAQVRVNEPHFFALSGDLHFVRGLFTVYQTHFGTQTAFGLRRNTELQKVFVRHNSTQSCFSQVRGQIQKIAYKPKSQFLTMPKYCGF